MSDDESKKDDLAPPGGASDPSAMTPVPAMQLPAMRGPQASGQVEMPWGGQPGGHAVSLMVGNMSTEAAILQRLPPEALPTVLENANRIADKQLDLQDKQLEREANAEEKQRERAHTLTLARETRDERRWYAQFGLVLLLTFAVVGIAIMLYHDGHDAAAGSLLLSALSFAGGFVAGKGYEQRQERAKAERKDGE